MLRQVEEILGDFGVHEDANAELELPLPRSKLTHTVLPSSAFTPKYVSFDTRGLEVKADSKCTD